MSHDRINQDGAGTGGGSGSLPLPTAMPAELVGVSRLLDELGETDRAAAPAGMESRVLRLVQARTAGGEPVTGSEAGSTDEHLARLGEAEREQAAASLEDRIFHATRAIITYQASQLRQPVPASGFMSSFAFRAAAGLLLGGGLIWSYLALRPAPGTSPFTMPSHVQTVATLEAQVDQELDRLSDVFSLAMISTDSDTQTSSSTDRGDTSDWPQFQFFDGGDS